jgi:hypothetical protein
MALKFETNITNELRLRSVTGELVDSQYGGQQYRFMSDAGAFYVSEPVGNILHDRFRRLGVAAGEAIEICKREIVRNNRKSIQWEVSRIGEAPAVTPAAAPAAASAAAPDDSMLERQLAASIAEVQKRKAPAAASTAAPGMQAWQQTLLNQTTAVIDVYAAALAHAGERHGNLVKSDDIRSILLSAFINLSKGGNSRAA